MESTTRSVTLATVEELAALVGLPLTPDQAAPLTRVLQLLLEGARVLDNVDLDLVGPAAVFRADWEGQR